MSLAHFVFGSWDWVFLTVGLLWLLLRIDPG